MSERLSEATRALVMHPTEPAILLGRRSESDKACPGKWGLFGGKIDEGETPNQAVTREVLEEAGVVFEAADTYQITENDRWKTWFITGSVQGEFDLNMEEHDAAHYFTVEEIRSLDIAFDHHDVIIGYLNSLR